MNAIYCGPPPIPQHIWTSWNFDPWLVLVLAGLAVAMRGSRAGLAGVFILVIAFVSPLCALSSSLFSARVVHHVLLVAIAAPLFAHAVKRFRRSGIALAFAVSTATLWVWHVPAAYDLALSNVAVYWFMQVTLLGSATWFWHALLADRTVLDRLGFLVAAFAQMGLLGAILTLAPEPLYAIHAVAPLDWGLIPLQDQQIGGLLMWVPAGIPYAVAAVLAARSAWSRSPGSAA